MKSSCLKYVASFVLMFSTNCFGSQVTNFYLNGINTTKRSAEETAIKLASLTSIEERFLVLYNSTSSFSSDLLEAAKQTRDWDNFYDENGNVDIVGLSSFSIIRQYLDHPNTSRETHVVVSKYANEFKQILEEDGDISDFMSEINSKVPDSLGEYLVGENKVIWNIHYKIVEFDKLVAAIGSHRYKPEASYLTPISQEYFDVNEMLRTLKSSEYDDQGINIIAHSQGNLFANRLLDYFNQPNRTRLLSVSTPDDHVYGESAGEGYVTLREDLAANAFIGEVPKNITNHDESFWEKHGLTFPVYLHRIIFSKILDTGEIALKNAKVYGDPLGHGMLEVYMHQDDDGPSKSKQVIIEKFRENYHDLASLSIEGDGCCGTGGSDGISQDLESIWFNDYLVENISISKQEVERGEDFSIQVTQQYYGTQSNADLPSSRVGYFCSSDNVWDSRDHYLDRDSSSIGSDDISDAERETLVIPEFECESGYILAVANYDGRINELDRSNNVAYVSIVIKDESEAGQDMGDVYITDPKVSNTLMRVGTEYRLSAKQCYEGNMEYSQLGKIRMRYYLSDDQTYSSDDDYIGFDDSTIDVNDSCDGESRYWEPSNSDKGNKYILFYADKAGDIDESDEHNNVGWVSVRIH